MISVYDIGSEDFEKNGDYVLHPTSCVMTEDAGGSYEIAMEHPITETDEWKHLVCGAIIKAPVPKQTIKNAYAGQEMDVYKTNGTTQLREEPEDATWITYTEWNSSNTYSVGDKVTCSGQSHRNYQCTYFDGDSAEKFVPPYNSRWWMPIQDFTAGSPALLTLPGNTEIYYIEESDTEGWSLVSTKQGIQGYVQDSQITFVRHEEVENVPEHTIEDQLFRIYSSQVRTDQKTVSVNARHVSYDLNGVLIGECKIALAEPAAAIAWIQDAFMTQYRGTIATDLTADDNGTYTGDLSYKNGTYAFLDPDNGIAPTFRAKLMRDNWDLFIMKDDMTDRGIRLAYGVNLRGVNWQRKSDSVVNRVMPVAKAEDGSDLFLPEMWVDSATLEDWPVIITERLQVNGQVGKDDGTGTSTVWTEETLLEEMRTKAEERFSVDHVDAVKVEIDVNFTLTGDSEEYKEYRDLEELCMYDLVTVYNSGVGIDQQLQVSRIQFDCIQKRFIGIKVGSVFDYGGRTVFGFNIGNGAINYEKISPEAVKRIIGEVE